MKYVMFQNDEGHMLPVIFPNAMIHSDMAEYIQHMMLMKEDQHIEPVSAGFVSMKGQVSGRSESLDLDSREEDAMYITFNDSVSTLPLDAMPPTVLETLKENMECNTVINTK